ncbi:MAG TPA: hypothetical protein VE568_07715 [Rubrobacter sp.]|jgi:hypothetical protein|nr:hypothetical protein [Rubrobacter sp.]
MAKMTHHIGKREEKVKFGLTLRRIVLLGTPLVLTVLLFFHPSPYDNVAGELMPIAGWWIALHTIGFVLFALMGVALWLLTAGLRGIVATVSWVAAVVFAVFYDAGDAIAGISTGILASSAEAGALGERAAVVAIETLWADPFKTLLFDIGRYAWIVALATAAVALYRAGAPRLPLVLLALPAFLVTFDHAFPFGSLTFGTFFVIAAWLELAPESASSSRQPHRVSGTFTTKNRSRDHD